MSDNPDLFELFAASTEGWNRAFRFHPENLHAGDSRYRRGVTPDPSRR